MSTPPSSALSSRLRQGGSPPSASGSSPHTSAGAAAAAAAAAQQEQQPPPPPQALPRQSAALPVPRSTHTALDIPLSASRSSAAGSGGVFGASPAWDLVGSWQGSADMYGSSPLIGTPFPYLVRQAPRQPHRPLRLGAAHLDPSAVLPVQHEGEEGAEGEGQQPGDTAEGGVLSPRSSGGFGRPPLYRHRSRGRLERWSLDGGEAGPAAAAAGGPGPAAGAEGSRRRTSAEEPGLTEPLLSPSDPAGPEPQPRSPDAKQLRPSASASQPPHTPLVRSLVFGLINSSAGIPALIAFAAIVFKDPVYAPYLDLLCKFFFLSSAIHQAVFCVLSTLPYAIGQVQDVGLIFLSAMASSIATLCAEAGRDAATALGTSLLTMTVSTFLVGLGTLVVARFRLAGLVQYLPLPVVGGYLGFVGYFCVASGTGLGVSKDIGTISSWVQLADWVALGKLVPTLGACAAMMLTHSRVAHPLGLPAVMAAIVLAFHATLLALGVSLERAQELGWAMRATEGEQQFWELWGLFNIRGFSLDGIYLSAALRQIGKFFGLFLVVCFGSCMDIAAIQQDTPQKIDFDQELTTVAVSNMAVGLVGCGYTGSYIFSQTIFTMRAGVFSRWNGAVVAASELLLAVLPFSVVQYMPNFFFGALLLWFGIEISRDWLIFSLRKLTMTEYLLLWASFGVIMQLGLEMGIGAGIVMAALYFSYAYAKSQVTSLGLVHMRSGVVRTLEQQAALDLFDARVVTARLRGFVFFGSANSIGIKLHQAAAELVEGDASVLGLSESAEVAVDHSRRSVGEGYEALKHTQALEALARAPRYMILDFTHATGLDATGARTFGMLDLLELGIQPLFTGIQDGATRELLAAHGVPLAAKRWPPPLAPPPAPGAAGAGSAGEPVAAAQQPAGDEAPPAGPGSEGEGAWQCPEFPTLEEGLRYCEDHFVDVAVDCGLCPPPTARVSLEALLRSHLPNVPYHPSADPAQVAHSLLGYLSRRALAPGERLWRRGDEAQDCYILEKGSVRMVTYHDEGAGGTRQRRRLLSGLAASPRALPLAGASTGVSIHEYGPGCVVGALDLYLHRPRASDAVAISPGGVRLLRLSSAKLAGLAAEAPQALNLVQAVLMRSVCRDLAVAMEAVACGAPEAD